MRMRRSAGMAAASLLVASLGACDAATPQEEACGYGELRDVAGNQLCVFEASIIETGFDCPPEFPMRTDFPGGVVCAPDGTLPPAGVDALMPDLGQPLAGDSTSTPGLGSQPGDPGSSPGTGGAGGAQGTGGAGADGAAADPGTSGAASHTDDEDDNRLELQAEVHGAAEHDEREEHYETEDDAL